MSKTYQAFGNTWEQLTLPGLNVKSSSVDSGDSRQTLGRNTYDPSWGLTDPKKCV